MYFNTERLIWRILCKTFISVRLWLLGKCIICRSGYRCRFQHTKAVCYISGVSASQVYLYPNPYFHSNTTQTYTKQDFSSVWWRGLSAVGQVQKFTTWVSPPSLKTNSSDHFSGCVRVWGNSLRWVDLIGFRAVSMAMKQSNLLQHICLIFSGCLK